MTIVKAEYPLGNSFTGMSEGDRVIIVRLDTLVEDKFRLEILAPETYGLVYQVDPSNIKMLIHSIWQTIREEIVSSWPPDMRVDFVVQYRRSEKRWDLRVDLANITSSKSPFSTIIPEEKIEGQMAIERTAIATANLIKAWHRRNETWVEERYDMIKVETVESQLYHLEIYKTESDIYVYRFDASGIKLLVHRVFSLFQQPSMVRVKHYPEEEFWSLRITPISIDSLNRDYFSTTIPETRLRSPVSLKKLATSIADQVRAWSWGREARNGESNRMAIDEQCWEIRTVGGKLYLIVDNQTGLTQLAQAIAKF